MKVGALIHADLIHSLRGDSNPNLESKSGYNSDSLMTFDSECRKEV